MARAASAHKLAWLALLISSGLYFFFANEADNDLFGHLLFGRLIMREGHVPAADPFSYTVAGGPWLNHEWLAQVIFAATWQEGKNAALLLFKAAAGIATFGLLFLVMKKRAGAAELAPYFLGIVIIAVLARGFPIRPQIFTYLGLAYVYYVIEQAEAGRRRNLWFLPFVFLIWANLHAGFVAGLGALGLWMLSKIISEKKTGREAYALVAACAAATFINPLGPGIYEFILKELGAPHPITEWQPVSLDFEHGAYFFTVFLALATLPFNRQIKSRPWEAALLLITLFLSLKHQRHTPLFAIAAAGPLARQMGGVWERLRERNVPQRISPFSVNAVSAGLLGLAIFQLSLLAAQFRRDGLEIVYNSRDYPWRVVNYVANSSAQNLKLAVPLEWGEYILWQLYPRARVSLDGRFAAVYPPDIVNAHFELFYGESSDSRLISENPPDAILSPADALCAPCRGPGWKPVFKDETLSVYAREGSDLERIFSEQKPLPRLEPLFVKLSGGLGFSEMQSLRIR